MKAGTEKMEEEVSIQKLANVSKTENKNMVELLKNHYPITEVIV